MIKPTAQQVKEYADSIGFDIDAEDFLNYYDMGGWVYGKSRTPIVDWKACVRTWKRGDAKRQRAAQGEKVKQQPRFYEPTVFVQCVKGPAVGRYLPVIFKDSHLKETSYEQYVLAAESWCKNLSQPEGVEWIIRENTTDRTLTKERSDMIKAKIDAAPKIKRRRPSQIKNEIRKQIKAITESFHHPTTDGQQGRDALSSEEVDRDLKF